MNPSPTERKPFDAHQRRVALFAQGITQQSIADACQCHQTLVSHVIAGAPDYQGQKCREVQQFIAQTIGQPVELVFPSTATKAA